MNKVDSLPPYKKRKWNTESGLQNHDHSLFVYLCYSCKHIQKQCSCTVRVDVYVTQKRFFFQAENTKHRTMTQQRCLCANPQTHEYVRIQGKGN